MYNSVIDNKVQYRKFITYTTDEEPHTYAYVSGSVGIDLKELGGRLPKCLKF